MTPRRKAVITISAVLYLALIGLLAAKVFLRPGHATSRVAIDNISFDLHPLWHISSNSRTYLELGRTGFLSLGGIDRETISVNPSSDCATPEVLAQAQQTIVQLSRKPWAPAPHWFQVPTRSGAVSCMQSFAVNPRDPTATAGHLMCLFPSDASEIRYYGPEPDQAEVLTMIHSMSDSLKCDAPPRAQERTP